MTHVVVVDDSKTFRLLLRSLLEPEGYSTSEASDGLEALDTLRTCTDRVIVLLDYRMPNMDGWQVLQAVEEAGAPLTSHEYIVVSGELSTFPLEAVDLLRHLSIRTLPKPFEKQTLISAVAQAAERLSSPSFEKIPDISEEE